MSAEPRRVLGLWRCPDCGAVGRSGTFRGHAEWHEATAAVPDAEDQMRDFWARAGMRARKAGGSS